MAFTNKRKANKNALTAPRKRIKSTEHLPWKTISRPSWIASGSGDPDGILELEEVRDVEVIYEETEAGKVARFSVPEVLADEDRATAARSSRSASPVSEGLAKPEEDEFNRRPSCFVCNTSFHMSAVLLFQ
jgi:ATP-dependent RNA helicase DDX24/MAK5